MSDISLRIFVLAGAVALAACGGSGGSSDVSSGDSAADAADSSGVDTGLDLLREDTRPVEDLLDLLLPDTGTDHKAEVVDVVVDPCEGTSCPEGYCNVETGKCEYCDDKVVCTEPGAWCRDSRCVQTLCVPGSKDCSSPTIARTCLEDGEAFDETQCTEGFGCHNGECFEVVCQPGSRRCGSAGMREMCAASGVVWLPASCPPGQACLDGQCRPLKHNLLVIFDTSSSMMSMGAMDAIPCICATGCSAKPFPACEDALCPRSKLGMSKHVFNKFFSSPGIVNVRLVLTHFPMKIKYPPALSCNDLFSFGRGYYGKGMNDSDWITGDDGIHVTTEGGWFDQNIWQILAVPFPKTNEEDNYGNAQAWVDFDEQVGPTETPCSIMADCPGGFCAPASEGADKVCWYHTNGEFRAIGNTPLGRSMFYAGEVYRKQVVIDGKACVVNEDCQNANYVCTVDGKCKDPYAKCRVNMILMFTDGVEEPATSTTEFFNPRVQAKRFRYGLGCESDADCFEGSICTNGLCGSYPHPNGGPVSLPSNTELPWHLQDYNGESIRIITHVIDMSGGDGASTNKGIADDGGGSYYHADELDPDELLGQLMKLVDPKENTGNCIPDFEGIPMEPIDEPGPEDPEDPVDPVEPGQ